MMNSGSYDTPGWKRCRLGMQCCSGDKRCCCRLSIRYDRSLICTYRNWLLSMNTLSISRLEAIGFAGICMRCFMALLRNSLKYRREGIQWDRSIFSSQLYCKQCSRTVAYFDYEMFRARKGRLVIVK